MKAPFRNPMLIMAALVCGAVSVPTAFATCLVPNDKGHMSRQSWTGPANGTANLLLVSESEPSMIGLWHEVFLAKGNGPGGPPDGTEVDNGLSEWHSDGTEETLDSRPPVTGDVCMGVWKLVSARHYTLNHFGIAFESADSTSPLGYANIRQTIVVSKDGKTFSGTFSIRQYDSSGNVLVDIMGDIYGTRIDSATTVGDLLGS